MARQTSPCADERPKRRLVYGRRLGRPLKDSAKRLLQDRLPLLAIPTGDSALQLRELFDSPDRPLWMEIGFGAGEHLNALMRQNPDRNFIGAEPFINGVAAFLKATQDLPTGNFRVHMDDALGLCARLPDGCLERLYILNPDPWPKKRHHKRRIVRPDTLDVYARLLKPGGELILATDVDDLAEWMVTCAALHPAFEWTAEGPEDWRRPREDWPLETRYARKGIAAGRVQTYLYFARRPGAAQADRK